MKGYVIKLMSGEYITKDRNTTLDIPIISKKLDDAKIFEDMKVVNKCIKKDCNISKIIVIPVTY